MPSAKFIGFGAMLALVGFIGRAQAQATYPVPNEYHPGGYPETYQGAFYPGTELRALPVALAQAVAARAEFERRQSDLNALIVDIRLSFVRSPEWADAVAEEQAAYEALQLIRRHTLANLQENSSYQSATALRDRVGWQIEQTRDKPQTTMEHLIALATVKLSYAASAASMEAAANAAAPETVDARQRLLAAGRRLSMLRQQLDEAVRHSPEVMVARKSLADARTAALASDAMYLQARNVANVSLDYAYHLYDHPYPYVINTPYIVSSYGGSVGYPIGYPYLWRDPISSRADGKH